MENTNVTEQSTNEIMPMAASGETNFASLPEKATPASGDMFLMEDSEDTKKINYDKLADAILNKLTSKTYSGLETTAKNFVTAINELNSKSGQSVTSKQAFLNAVKKHTNVPITIRIPGTVLSEITNSKYSSSAKGIAVYDGTHIDFIFAHENGSAIITGRAKEAGTLTSLYHYTGTSALDN